jgi:8-oxo-dGTP diphosphatase
LSARYRLVYHHMTMEATGALQVTAAVIFEEGRVLITERPVGGRHPGAWEFPGGKVEPGETPEECLARELAEELGITVSVGERLAVVRHSYPDLVIDLIAFECRVTDGEPRDIGCAAHAWVRSRELSRYDLLPPDRELAGMLNPGGD